MSRLMKSFDLLYDLKSTEALDQFIRQAVNSKEFMFLMLSEIQDRYRQIEQYLKLIAELQEEIIMNDIVSKAHQKLVGELMVPDHPAHKATKSPIQGAVFGQAPVSFCRSCGASIPHRDGEVRCHDCMHHLPLVVNPNND